MDTKITPFEKLMADAYNEALKVLASSNKYKDTNKQKEVLKAIVTKFSSFLIENNKAIKFLPAIVKMFLNGDFGKKLDKEDVINKFTKALELLISTDYKKYDSNLNRVEDIKNNNGNPTFVSAQTIIDRYVVENKPTENTKDTKDTKNTKNTKDTKYTKDTTSSSPAPSPDSSQPPQKKYNIISIESFEEAKKYSNFVGWNITKNQGSFNSYSSNGYGKIYFCLRNGYATEEKSIGNDSPLDSYGLSMLAVCVDSVGSLFACISRWNYENGGNDNMLSEHELSNLLGVNFQKVFKPSAKWKNDLENVYKSLKNPNIPLKNIFISIQQLNNNVSIVEFNKKFNLVNVQSRKILFDNWYDRIKNFHNDIVRVMLNNKCNLINISGKTLLNPWVDNIRMINNGLAVVKLDKKYNFVNLEGKLLTNTWYDAVETFNDDCARVKIDKKYNIINSSGKLISKKWYDAIGEFINGVAKVKKDNKYNYINQVGTPLTNVWLSSAWNFKNNNSTVVLPDKRKGIIDKDGNIKLMDGTVINKNGKEIKPKIKNKPVEKGNINESYLKKIVNYYLC